MHGGHVAVVLQSASHLQRDSVGESPRFCNCTCQQFPSHAKIEHGNKGRCNLNPSSPFAFKGEIHKNLSILRFLLPLFAENTEIILSGFAPSTQRFFRRRSNAENGNPRFSILVVFETRVIRV
jgi:hypothetical protein